jgi:hypothetical protein
MDPFDPNRLSIGKGNRALTKPYPEEKPPLHKKGEKFLKGPVPRSVVDKLRGMHPNYVFTYRGHRVCRMFNGAWKRARAKIGLNRVRVHDLKHTCGRRLRAAGVPLETRKILLGHTNGDITTYYSAPELQELVDAMELIGGTKSGKNPALTLLRVREERVRAPYLCVDMRISHPRGVYSDMGPASRIELEAGGSTYPWEQFPRDIQGLFYYRGQRQAVSSLGPTR